jgi:hypothetical protein
MISIAAMVSASRGPCNGSRRYQRHMNCGENSAIIAEYCKYLFLLIFLFLISRYTLFASAENTRGLSLSGERAFSRHVAQEVRGE